MFEPVVAVTVEVENPRHVELMGLRLRVLDAGESLGRALRLAAEQMQSGTAWTGPTAARVFTGEISGRSERLPRLVDQVLDEVEHELAMTPRTVMNDAP